MPLLTLPRHMFFYGSSAGSGDHRRPLFSQNLECKQLIFSLTIYSRIFKINSLLMNGINLLKKLVNMTEMRQIYCF